MASTAAVRPGPARRRPRRQLPPDDVPVVSGRYYVVLALLAAVVLFPYSKLGDVVQSASQGPPPTDTSNWQVGKTSRVRITLITADYQLLACASNQNIEGYHCAYRSETQPWPAEAGQPLDDNKADIIQPYRTWPENQLMLVAGLWNEPTVAQRLHREPFRGVASKKLARFVADCEVKFIGRLNPRLRWNPGAQWTNEGDALVAKPLSCKISGE